MCKICFLRGHFSQECPLVPEAIRQQRNYNAGVNGRRNDIYFCVLCKSIGHELLYCAWRCCVRCGKFGDFSPVAISKRAAPPPAALPASYRECEAHAQNTQQSENVQFCAVCAYTLPRAQNAMDLFALRSACEAGVARTSLEARKMIDVESLVELLNTNYLQDNISPAAKLATKVSAVGAYLMHSI